MAVRTVTRGRILMMCPSRTSFATIHCVKDIRAYQRVAQRSRYLSPLTKSGWRFGGTTGSHFMTVEHFCCTVSWYATLQAIFGMITMRVVFQFSDIDIISISVQRFSEVPQAGMTMGLPYGQSVFDFPATTCWEGVGVILKEYLN